MVTLRLDEMNDYKKCLRYEMERLRKELLQVAIQNNVFAPLVEEQGRGIPHSHMQILTHEIS